MQPNPLIRTSLIIILPRKEFFLGSNLPIKSDSFWIHYCIYLSAVWHSLNLKWQIYLQEKKTDMGARDAQTELEQEEGKQTDTSLYFDLMFAAVHKW